MNKIITYRQLSNALAYLNCDVPISAGINLRIYGKPLIILDDGSALIFDACEYCGGKGLDKRNCCASCGAQPTGKLAPELFPDPKIGVIPMAWDAIVEFFDNAYSGLYTFLVGDVV